MLRKIITLISFLTALCFLAGVSLAAAKDGKPLVMRSGLIQNPQLVYNSGPGSLPDLQVTVVLPKSLDELWSGQADAWLVVWMPAGAQAQSSSTLRAIQLTGENLATDLDWSPDHPRNVITIQGSLLAGLPEGDYQLGLVLTSKNDPAPTAVGSWYGGFNGLLSVAHLKITMNDYASATDDSSDGEDGTGLIPY